MLKRLGLLAVGFWQATDAVALQTAVQRRARQVRDHVLECDIDIIQREARLHPQSHDGYFLHRRKHGAAALLRPHRQVFDRLPMTPFQDGLLVDPIPLREARDRNLRSL
jgi:hypothetical protein